MFLGWYRLPPGAIYTPFNTLLIILEWVGRANIVLIHRKTKEFSVAFNKGIDEKAGSFVFFLSSPPAMSIYSDIPRYFHHKSSLQRPANKYRPILTRNSSSYHPDATIVVIPTDHGDHCAPRSRLQYLQEHT